jgi:hypothetical protein
MGSSSTYHLEITLSSPSPSEGRDKGYQPEACQILQRRNNSRQMASQIVAASRVGPRPLLHSPPKKASQLYEIKLQLPSKLTRPGGSSYKCHDLVFNDVHTPETEKEATERNGISMFFQYFACCSEMTAIYLGTLGEGIFAEVSYIIEVVHTTYDLNDFSQ